MTTEAKAKLSSKRQLTVPARMARALGLTPGSAVILRLEDGRIVLIPAPEDYTVTLAGRLRGAYGPEVDRYVRQERASWDQE